MRGDRASGMYFACAAGERQHGMDKDESALKNRPEDPASVQGAVTRGFAGFNGLVENLGHRAIQANREISYSVHSVMGNCFENDPKIRRTCSGAGRKAPQSTGQCSMSQ